MPVKMLSFVTAAFRRDFPGQWLSFFRWKGNKLLLEFVRILKN